MRGGLRIAITDGLNTGKNRKQNGKETAMWSPIPHAASRGVSRVYAEERHIRREHCPDALKKQRGRGRSSTTKNIRLRGKNARKKIWFARWGRTATRRNRQRRTGTEEWAKRKEILKIKK